MLLARDMSSELVLQFVELPETVSTVEKFQTVRSPFGTNGIQQETKPGYCNHFTQHAKDI